MKDRRFLVVGLPRSGTTYLMTLLNAHRDIACSGEQYNPHAIVGVEVHDTDPATLVARDARPLRFLEQFFATAEASGVARAGFKYMIGHHARVLRHLDRYPDIRLIYVWRENKLAQVSSYFKALESQRWAQYHRDLHIHQKIDVDPRKILERWNEFATMDMLFRDWLKQQPHPSLTVEYRDLFQPGFNARICDFLDVPVDPGMKSPLVKQNANAILKRFKHPGPIERYFRAVGCGHWLDPEL